MSRQYWVIWNDPGPPCFAVSGPYDTAADAIAENGPDAFVVMRVAVRLLTGSDVIVAGNAGRVERRTFAVCASCGESKPWAECEVIDARPAPGGDVLWCKPCISAGSKGL